MPQRLDSEEKLKQKLRIQSRKIDSLEDELDELKGKYNKLKYNYELHILGGSFLDFGKLFDEGKRTKNLITQVKQLKKELEITKAELLCYKDGGPLMKLRNKILEEQKISEIENKVKDKKNILKNITEEYKNFTSNETIKPSVYAYVDSSNNIVYIGSSKNIIQRDYGHLRNSETYFDKNYNDKSQYKLISLATCDNIDDARAIEQLMILKYEPVYNVSKADYYITQILNSDK